MFRPTMESGSLAQTFSHLPIASVLDQLRGWLREHASVVLVAPPGAGKTTAVPLALLDEPWLNHRRILLLAPRRLAARAAARRMAALLDQKVGRTVGYRVRLESRVGPETRIEVVTEGVLTRMLQSDPSLEGVGLVIFDEFHERNLDADLGLALCREVQGVLNDALRLLVMSATLDPAPVADLLGGAPLVQCAGRTFPVETRYVNRPATQPVERATVDVIRRSVAAEEGNLLVFLPGAPEIRRLARLLEEAHLPGRWTVTPLFGRLPRDRQDAALLPPPAGRNKIVLATAIAETSLTIDGIGVVVDSGLQRAPRFDPVSGMTRLITLPVSRASADQRKGRAGRLGPGICYRLWRQDIHAALVPANRPEILDADLAGLVLELALWGVAEPSDLGWLDPPPSAAFSRARQLLQDLKALNREGKITAHGRSMAALPLHPRLAHMIMTARRNRLGHTACDMAALLSERDPLHFTGRERNADLKLRLEALHAYKVGQIVDLPGCRADRSALRHVFTVSEVLRRRMQIPLASGGPAEPGRLLALAYPDRIAQRRPGSQDRYLLTSGRGACFGSPDALTASEYLVAAHLDGQRREARIFLAAAIDKQDLLDHFDHRTQWRETIDWDSSRQAVTARRRLMLGALTLENEPWKQAPSEAVTAALVAGIRKSGIVILPWSRRLRSWQARVKLLAGIGARGGPWTDVSDETLADTLETWLSPYLAGIFRVDDLAAGGFASAMHSLLTWRQQRLLDELAPTHWTVPSGSRLPIDYHAEIPVLAVRVQEMFGATETPAIADGRVPLMLHLLSPAGRPTQITRDLAGFWKNGYLEVKKELKGRYPKHVWPDDPLRASPTARAKRRRSN